MAKAKASKRKSDAAVGGAPGAELGWIDAGDGYALALDGSKLVARNAKGARMASVPKGLKDGDAAEQLVALRDWLGGHERECREDVETWMLRSLPVPRAALVAVWDDPAWRTPLENAVVLALDAAGEPIDGAAGFFRGADAHKGVGVVDLDGETRWTDAARILIPHPILLAELNDYRELATELGVTQGIAQLFRETFVKGKDVDAGDTTVSEFAQGKFAMLVHVLGKAKTLGYRVRGGFAVCPVWERGAVVEARYWIGSEDPMSETWTGELLWVDARDRTLKLGEVGEVAWSEGTRMASALYAARVVEKKEEG